MFKVLEYFFEELALGDIETTAGLFGTTQHRFFTPREREEYNRFVREREREREREHSHNNYRIMRLKDGYDKHGGLFYF